MVDEPLRVERLMAAPEFPGDFLEALVYAGKAGNPRTREVRDYSDKDRIVRVDLFAEWSDEGYADRSVRAVFMVDDGAWVFLSAGCDTTGWDCQAGGTAEWADAREDLLALITAEDRQKLGLP